MYKFAHYIATSNSPNVEMHEPYFARKQIWVEIGVNVAIETNEISVWGVGITV